MMGRSGVRRLLRVRGSTVRDSVREVDEEIRLHLEQRTAELMASGLDAATAAARAREMFAAGAPSLDALYALAIERDRHMRVRERLESVVQDFRYATRSLLRDPWVMVFIVLSLALGVGANIAAFGMADRLLVRPPAHVVDADRVVRLYGELDFLGRGTRTSSYMPHSAYLQFRAVPAFEEVGAYRLTDRYVGGGEDARRERVGTVLGEFFPLLGVQPVRGRFFGADEDGTDALVVISSDLWRTRFGGAPDVLGQTIRIDDMPHTIIGVAPPGFTGTEARRVAAWTLGSEAEARSSNWNVVGRLRANATAEMAGVQATTMHQPEASGSFAWFRDVRVFAAPLNRGEDGRLPFEATLVRWLAAVTTVILLITCASVINLLLVRLARRRRELAVRISLGSGRARVIRLVAAEGLVLALAAGVASLLVARLLEPPIQRALFADQAGWEMSFVDVRILGIAAAIAFVTALCVGLVPALQTRDLRVGEALRTGRRDTPPSARMRGLLTIVQATLSVALLVGAGLFLRSMANVNALDLGVDAERVITAEASFGSVSFAEFENLERTVYPRLEEAALRVRGIDAAATAIGLPLDGGSFSAPVWASGRDSIPTFPGGGPWVGVVNAGYFETIGTRIVEGRAFTAADRAGSEPVVVINQTMAAALWPGEPVLNRCLHIGAETNPCARVVGIAEDVHRVGLREPPSLQYYMPIGQQDMFGGARLVIRTAPGGRVSLDELRRALAGADPAVRAVELHDLSESLADDLRPLRLGIVTFGISGALALLVAVLGLYSVMAYLVAWRTHEIGVRVALGATRRNVIRLVLRSGLALAATGIVLGLALALYAGRWIEPHLFETSARDAGVMATVALGLLATAALAGWLPARRATRIDPTEALRAE